MVTLIRVSNAIIIHQSACIDIESQRNHIRLHIKSKLFYQFSRRTLPNQIIRIDETAYRFKHRFRRLGVFGRLLSAQFPAQRFFVSGEHKLLVRLISARYLNRCVTVGTLALALLLEM